MPRYNEWCSRCGRPSWGAPTCNLCLGVLSGVTPKRKRYEDFGEMMDRLDAEYDAEQLSRMAP